MPDFDRVKYHSDGTVTVTPSKTVVARWKKHPNGGWDVEAVIPDIVAHDPRSTNAINATPRKGANSYVMRWFEEMKKRGLIVARPDRIRPLDTALHERAQALVGDMEVDLDEPLSADDE